MNEKAPKEVLSPHPIDIEFFSKQSNKTTKLVNSLDGFKVDGSNRWYEFGFIEPVYISSIEIFSEGYDKWYNFDLEVVLSDGSVHEKRLPAENNLVKLELGKLSNSFRFRPESRWARKTAILRVVVHGYTLKEFHRLEWSLQGIETRERDVEEKEAKVADLDAEAKAHQQKINDLTVEVGKLTAEQSALTETTANTQEQLEKRQSKLKDLQSSIENLGEERRSIRSDISISQSELDKLTKTVRLFPSEISGFVEQGKRNIVTYILLGLPFAAIFVIVLWTLFSSAIDLTQLWKKGPDVDVWTIFLTRIPFVLVAFALIEACGFVVGRLIFEIIKINRQRLDFQKLSIVAKDVVTSAAADVGMTDEQRFEEETKLKMALLQEHMKSHADEEFRYTGSAITSALIGVAKRFSGAKD